MSLNERLKTARATLGLSQSAIAKAAGSTLPSWQAYEAGKNVPGGRVLEGLAKLGINVNWLLTGGGDIKIDEESTGDDFTAGRFRIMRGDLSVRDFAKKAGFLNLDYSEKHLKRIEAGEDYPNFHEILVFCDHLDINPLWLFGYHDQPMFRRELVNPTVDFKLLRDIIEEAVIHESVSKNQLTADKKANLIIELYKMRVAKKDQ